MTKLVRNVTAENYSKLGSGYIATSDAGSGFLIAKAPGMVQGVRFEPTPHQWRAWLSYFKRKKINHNLMKLRDYYTVPAEWPHLFDADVTVQEDFING